MSSTKVDAYFQSQESEKNDKEYAILFFSWGKQRISISRNKLDDFLSKRKNSKKNNTLIVLENSMEGLID